MSGGDANVACQQCNESFSREDVKETYDEQLEICGFICNPCCIKIAESARRCQISDCKTKPDSGPTGFRTLPSKFHDLPEGEVKRRIIKQFGIFRNVRACCNMCYVRISKSVVQTKIVYGEGFPRQSKSSPSIASKHISQSTVEKTAQSRDDRLSQYTGPKFTRRSGSALFWDKIKLQDNTVASNVNELVGENNDRNLDVNNDSLNNRNQGDKMNSDTSYGKTNDSVNETANGRPDKLDINKCVDASDAKGNKIQEFSYSSIPISPTSMRFRRIQPKVSRYDEFDLSNDDIGDNIELESPSCGRKRSRSNDDETWSPGRAKKDKSEGRGLYMKKNTPVSSSVMSDFVSCTGCRKICSSKETQPVFDDKKQINVRLCQDCRRTSSQGSFACPINGCLTPKGTTCGVQINVNLQTLAGGTLKILNEMGVNMDTKKCCKNCLKNIDEIIKKNEKGKDKKEKNTDEQVFTMCRNCCKIVPMKNTCPNIEENGRKCGVLCQICSGGQDDVKDTEGKRDKKVPKRLKGYEQSVKSIGFCTAKGCVHAGEKEPVQLVSGKKILRNYLDERMLRAEFNLADDMDYCCRSCHARIKWFVADMRKKELGVGADSKNSLKNLTPKAKAEIEKIKEEQLSMQSEEKLVEESKENDNQREHISARKESGKQSLDQHCTSTSEMNDQPEISDIQKLINNNMKSGKKETIESGNDKGRIAATKNLPISEVLPVKNPVAFQPQTLSSNFSSKSTIIIPPGNTTMAGHPPVLQVGGQQFVLNVISRCEKECQTDQNHSELDPKQDLSSAEKGVQVNIPLMPKFEGTVPANLPNGKKVKYVDAKEKTKYAVKRAGKELFDQFLQQLDDISGGCAQQLLSDIYRSKEVVMATNYEKILSSIGLLYRNTDKSNRQERVRLLSTVALHAPNETLKRFFQRSSKKGDLISVNEAEIVQAREYAKQFGPGTHVMPIGQVPWKNIALAGETESTADDISNENETEQTAEKMDTEGGGVKGGSKITTEEENFVKSDESVKPDVPLFKADDDKKLITLEKMMKSERKRGESGREQLVTFKVTVRHAKEKLEGGDGNGTLNSIEEMDEGSEINGTGKRTNQIEHHKNGNETNKNKDEVAKKSEGISLKRQQRKSTGSLDTGEIRVSNQTKRLKRKSLDGQLKDKAKCKNDISKGGVAGSSQEKRKRTAFNNEKKRILEQYFEKSIYASKTVVEEISKELGIDKKKVDNWFRNRRSKLKKDDEERTKRNVELKTRKGGKKAKTEKEKGVAEGIGDGSFKDGVAEEEKNEKDNKSESAPLETSHDNKGRDGAIENDTKESEKEENGDKDTEIKNEDNDITREELRHNAQDLKIKLDVHDKNESMDKENAFDDTKSNGNVIHRICELETKDKCPFVKETEIDGNGVKSEDQNLLIKNQQQICTKIENDDLTEDFSKKKLSESYIVSESAGSNIAKNESVDVENEYKEKRYLNKKQNIGEMKEIAKDENPDSKSTLEKVKCNANDDNNDVDDNDDDDDDGNNEKSGRHNVGKSVILRESLEDSKCQNKTQLPAMPSERTSDYPENRNEMLVKTVSPLQLVETPNLRIATEDSNNSKITVKYGDEMVTQIHDQRLEQSDNIVEKSWSSITHGSTFSLGVIDEYENVESNDRDDLALALNSDPEFMKDFSELMNITKTY